jgi:hypothetical protein
MKCIAATVRKDEQAIAQGVVVTTKAIIMVSEEGSSVVYYGTCFCIARATADALGRDSPNS